MPTRRTGTTPSTEPVKFASASVTSRDVIAHRFDQNFTFENIAIKSTIATLGAPLLLLGAGAIIMGKDGNPLGYPFIAAASVFLITGAMIEAGRTVQQTVARNPVSNDVSIDEVLNLLRNLNAFEDYQLLDQLIDKIIEGYKPGITTSKSSKELYETCLRYKNNPETKVALDEFKKCNEAYKKCVEENKALIDEHSRRLSEYNVLSSNYSRYNRRPQETEKLRKLELELDELERKLDDLLAAKQSVQNISKRVVHGLNEYIAENNNKGPAGKNAGKSLYNHILKSFMQLSDRQWYAQLIPTSFRENLTLKLDPAQIVDALLQDEIPFSKKEIAEMAKYKEEVYRELEQNPEKARAFYEKAFDENGVIKKNNFAGVFVAHQRGMKAVSIDSGVCHKLWTHNQFLKAIDKLAEIGGTNYLDEEEKAICRKSIEAYIGKNKLLNYLNQLSDEALKEKMYPLFGVVIAREKEAAAEDAVEGTVVATHDETIRKQEDIISFVPADKTVEVSPSIEIGPDVEKPKSIRDKVSDALNLLDSKVYEKVDATVRKHKINVLNAIQQYLVSDKKSSDMNRFMDALKDNPKYSTVTKKGQPAGTLELVRELVSSEPGLKSAMEARKSEMEKRPVTATLFTRAKAAVTSSSNASYLEEAIKVPQHALTVPEPVESEKPTGRQKIGL